MKICTKVFIVLMLLVSTAKGQYCMLPGRTPYSPDQPGITNFKLAAVNRSSLGVESMSQVVVETNDSITLGRGKTYTVTISDSRDAVNFPTARNNIRVWIDYNKNFSYDDAGETVITNDLHTPGTFTGTFTVPSTVPLGRTMLRATVKMSADAGHTLPTSCDNPADPIGYHGEMEDYVVSIVNAAEIGQPLPLSEAVTVFPNPTANQLTVSLGGLGSNPVSIELYDISGKLLRSLLSNSEQAVDHYTFDLDKYVSLPGVYFIKIVSGSSFTFKRIVKLD